MTWPRRRTRERSENDWLRRLGEPNLRVALDIEAGPPFLGEVLGLSASAVFLLVWGAFGLPGTVAFAVFVIILLGLSLLGGRYVVRRAVAKRWMAAVGVRPPASMLLGIAGDRLVIWRWPRRGHPAPGRLVDLPLAEVTLRSRAAPLGCLEVGPPNGMALLVSHQSGPQQRTEVARLLEMAAAARRSDGTAQFES